MNHTGQGKQIMVVIFGATGNTGSAVVKRALDLGHKVTVKDITLEISIPDTADFTVQQLQDDTCRYGRPGLSY